MDKLSINEAVAEFHAILRAELGPETAAVPCADVAETAEEAEARYFRCAEALLRAACPDPADCTDQRCRRGGLCRHLADLRSPRQASQGRPATRRTPGAAALRQSILVYMQQRRLHAGTDGEAAEGGARNAVARRNGTS